MDVEVLVIVLIYLALMAIPMLHNHRVVVSRSRESGRSYRGGSSPYSVLDQSIGSRNVVVVLGNLDNTDIEKVMEFLRKNS